MASIESIDIYRIRAFDLETPKTQPGYLAPPPVVGSMAELVGNEIRGDILYPPSVIEQTIALYLKNKFILSGANLAFDMSVIAQNYPWLLAEIFLAYREERVIDVSIVQTLDAIYGGHIGKDPRHGGELRNPSTNKPTDRYALATVLDLVTGRTDAKDEAAWRKSYALLAGLPLQFWPPEARAYPVHDTRNTFEATIKQLQGWTRGRMEPEEHGPARNFTNQAKQAEVAFCLQLGAAHSFRTNAAKVEALSEKVEKLHEKAVERFQKFGWIRPPIDTKTGEPDPDAGKEDQAAVRRAVAAAYGATGTCKRCKGAGQVHSVKMVPCRGEKVKGRFKGCRFAETPSEFKTAECVFCFGSGLVKKVGNLIVCKNVYAEDDTTIEAGCDGAGLDLSTSPMLPRSSNKDHPGRQGSISTSRDTLMESGDEELAAYGEDEFEKIKSTFVPFLRSGTVAPLKLTPNVLVASGRISYEGGPFHQMTRGGGVRQCVEARDGRVLSMTDYEAGELCTLGQVTYWMFGKSLMRDAINESGKPGILHSELAASVMQLPIGEFLARLKNKDKQCVDFRQASKPINFGTPGGMGSAKLVWTARKKNAGFTECEFGPMLDDDGKRGYAGIRFCILVGGAKRCGIEKIMEWKKRPTFPVCKACVEIVEHTLRATYFKRFPEIREYFDKVSSWIKQYGRVPCLAWNDQTGKVEILRWRGGVDFPAGCNNGFQALLADIMKLAYVTMTREAYLGVTDDGQPSPLAGARFPVVMHDEPIGELWKYNAHLSGPRIGHLMEWAGKKLAPDVTWVAQTALSECLDKNAEPVKDKDGNLTIWYPKKAA